MMIYITNYFIQRIKDNKHEFELDTYLTILKYFKHLVHNKVKLRAVYDGYSAITKIPKVNGGYMKLELYDKDYVKYNPENQLARLTLAVEHNQHTAEPRTLFP